jgi:formylmethanofuran dehydrogenase subunit E
MILRVIILLILIILLYIFIKQKFINKNQNNRIDDLVKCDKCNTFIVKYDSVKKNSKYFCKKECQ